MGIEIPPEEILVYKNSKNVCFIKYIGNKTVCSLYISICFYRFYVRIIKLYLFGLFTDFHIEHFYQ